MCGRFVQAKTLVEYAHAFDPAWTPGPLDLIPSWNMAPSRQALVFHDNETGHVAELLKWGFLPSWADDKATKPINARVETAATSPYFRRAWQAGRCLVPADGWYEWKETAVGKQPYFIHRADGQPVLMAGLYETNQHAKITTFTILTMDAGGELRKLHDREPLVLSAEAGRQWIRQDLSPGDVTNAVKTLLRSSSFAWHTVSAKVNNPRNNAPDLISQT